MMRKIRLSRWQAPAVIVLVGLLVGCGGGSGSFPLASASAHPELTSREILDRISKVEPQSGRVTVDKKGTFGGHDSDEHSETMFVGNDYFTDLGNLQVLDYGGVLYTRDSEGDLWRKADPRLSQVVDSLQTFRDGLKAARPSPGVNNVVRRPDEVIDGHQVVHVVATIEVSGQEADFADSMRKFLDSLPIPQAHGVTIPTISRFDTTSDIWLDADSFQYRAFGISAKAYNNDDVVFSSEQKTVISDINTPLELPGPLPSEATVTPTPSGQ
jgi:hypothetical protein